MAEQGGIVPTLPYGGNGGFGGGDGIWALVLLAVLFGNGGFGGNNNYATQGYVASEFTQRDVNGGFQNTNNLINQTQNAILAQTNELNTNILTTALTMQSKMDECCCSLRAQGIENTQKILDAMQQNTINELRSEVNDLKNTITANNIGTTIINALKPTTTT